MSAAERAAVFLDRDGTLVEDPGYLHDPERVRLLPGVAEGLASLSAAGWPLIVVSNQSGIARGLYRPEAFYAVMARIGALLPRGTGFAASYFCPHHPDFTGPCSCRKPGTGLFELASREHGLDLAQSWWIGDHWRDVEPALAFRARAVLVGDGHDESEAQLAVQHRVAAVPTFREAAAHILRSGA